jgi:hypothetical protein
MVRALGSLLNKVGRFPSSDAPNKGRHERYSVFPERFYHRVMHAPGSR